MVVMFDDRFECGERAVMHKGTAPGDLAQARRLEGVLHLDDAGHELSATDVFGGKTDVLEALVGEIPPLMAGRALRLAIEQGKAALGFFRYRFLAAFDPGIERRPLRYHRPLIG